MDMFKLTLINNVEVMIDSSVCKKILDQEEVEFNGLLGYEADDTSVYTRCAYVPGAYFKIETIDKEQ